MWVGAATAASQEGSMGYIPDVNRHNEAQAFRKQKLLRRNCQWPNINEGLPKKVHTDTKQMGPLAGMSEGSIGTPQPAWEAGTAESGRSKVSSTARVICAGTRYYA
jgi:hypothetical protein